MATLPRYLQSVIELDLDRKMVFVGGPRQVGKTRLGRTIVTDPAAYLSFDIPAHREAILKGELPPTRDWFFDEIHKYRGWRNFLKGLYDAAGTRKRILVTGSARLDFYRYGGDSLQGRYFYLRLHPLTLAEVGGRSSADLAALLHLSGFPEPFLSGDETQARRWSLAYRERLVREEVTGLEGDQRPVQARAAGERAAAKSRQPALAECAARGPAGQPSDGRPLAGRARAPVCDLSGRAVWRAPPESGQQGAEALSLRLDRRS